MIGTPQGIRTPITAARRTRRHFDYAFHTFCAAYAVVITSKPSSHVVAYFRTTHRIVQSGLLQRDGYESWFENPESVLFNFAKDSMYVNERSRYSASSMVIMKNSIRAAMFLYSLGDDQTRFPRLFIMDNMEDKGMTPERSHNFQHMLVERCNEISGDFQFIFTTSMIDPDLDIPNYVIGPFYPKGKHTLEFV